MNRKAAAWVAAIAAVVAGAGACSNVTFEGGGPVSIELTADRTTAKTGQDVNFLADAVGAILDGIVLAYGDGEADTLFTSGSQTAHGRFVHAYEATGTFSVVGTVYDGRQGPASDTVVIQVTGG